jgi:hypothetical protein
MLSIAQRQDLLMLLTPIVGGDEKRLAEVLPRVSEGDREEIAEFLQTAANIIDPDGHDCREESEAERCEAIGAGRR